MTKATRAENIRREEERQRQMTADHELFQLKEAIVNAAMAVEIWPPGHEALGEACSVFRLSSYLEKRRSDQLAIRRRKLDAIAFLEKDVVNATLANYDEHMVEDRPDIAAACSALLKAEKATETVLVEPTHQLWTTFDDDDWGGATCGQWIGSLKGLDVRLQPPSDCSPDLLFRIQQSITAVAQSVEILPNEREKGSQEEREAALRYLQEQIDKVTNANASYRGGLEDARDWIRNGSHRRA